MDLMKDRDAYVYGLFLSDGHLSETTRNRGKLSLELNIKDIEILYQIEKVLNDYSCRIRTRRRDSNFKCDYESCSITFHSLDLRNEIKGYGFPTGKKSDIINVPKCEYNEKGFWRGFIDGDGSLAISKNNIPLVSLTTKSETLKDSYLFFLERVTGERKTLNRNTRDNCYNIVSYRERAQILTEYLGFVNSEIGLSRKRDSAYKILSWSR